MEAYQYPPSYPDSHDSSPRSREIDFENPTPWEEQQNYKAKFMCSYGGKIQPRTHDNQLSYVGGDTKILAVDRTIKFQSFLSKLSSLCDAPPQDITFKYQLPGEELDALISVTNDDDLEHLMHEYDRLYRPSSKPVRMRLFLFTSPNSAPQPDPIKPQSNVDFLFGLEKTLPIPIPTPPHPLPHPPSYASVPEPVAQISEYPPRGPVVDRLIGSDTVEIQRQLQRLHVAENEQNLYRRRSEDGFSGGYAAAAAAASAGGGGSGGEYYMQKVQEKVVRSDSPVTVPQGYWPEKQFSADGFQQTGTAVSGGEQPVYMMPAPGAFYPAPVMRPQVSQGYYAVQRMASDGYREQAVYGGVLPQQGTFSSAGSGGLSPAQPVKPSAYGEGYGVVRPSGVPDNAGGAAAAAYAQVAYDSASGRHVYYTAPPGMVHAPQYQGVGPVVSNDMRQTGVPVGQDVKGVNKSSQGSV